MEYLIGFIILGVIAMLGIFGVGKRVKKDFMVNEWVFFAFVALIIGLNFIPTIVWGGFSFRIGTMLLLLLALLMHFVGGKGVNRVFTLMLTIILTGITYGATRLAAMFSPESMFADVNWVYALVVGLVAFLFTRNARYGFISGVVSMFAAHVLASIGRDAISLEPAFNSAVIAGGFALVLFAIVTAAIPKTPSRISYYFEAGRLED